MDVDGIVIAFFAALSGGGGVAALHKSKAEQQAAREKNQLESRIADLAQVNAAQAELNEDERAFRQAVREEVERLNKAKREDDEYHESRYKRLGAAFDDMATKYANMRADYHMLNDRYIARAREIQDLTKVTAERDFYKIQAKTYGDELERMAQEHAAEILGLRKQIEALESKVSVLTMTSGKDTP